MKNLVFKGFFALACLMSLTLQAQVVMSGRVTHHCTGAGYAGADVYIARRDDNNSPIIVYARADADGYWSAAFPCRKDPAYAASSFALVSISKPIRVSTYNVDYACETAGNANGLDFTVVPNLPLLKYQSSSSVTPTSVADGTTITGCQQGDNGAAFSYTPQASMFYRLVIYYSDVYGSNLGIAAASGWSQTPISGVAVNPLMSNLAGGDYLVQLEENCDGSNFSQKWGGPEKRITYVRGASQYDVDFSFGVFQSVDGSSKNYPRIYNSSPTDGLLGRSAPNDLVQIPYVGPRFTSIYLNSGTNADKAAVTSYTLTLRQGGGSASPILATRTWNNATSLPNLLYLSELVAVDFFEQPANVNQIYRAEFTAVGPCGTKQAWSRFFIVPNDGTCSSWPNCFAGDGGVFTESLKKRLNDPSNTLESKRNLELMLASVSSEAQSKNNLFGVYVSPNPTNGNTNLSFFVNEANNVDVQLYDIAGKLMTTALPKQYFEKGTYQTTLPTEGVAKGAYIYKITVGKETVSGKVIKF